MKRLGDAELEIMETIWAEKEPVTAACILKKTENEEYLGAVIADDSAGAFDREGVCMLRQKIPSQPLYSSHRGRGLQSISGEDTIGPAVWKLGY